MSDLKKEATSLHTAASGLRGTGHHTAKPLQEGSSTGRAAGVPREEATMTRSVDRTKSLEQLDGERWGEPPADATSLVRTVHDWRRRPIGSLEPHELARLIGQDVGLPWLLPLAVDVLRQEAEEQAAGGFLDGDLLYAVVTRGPGVWERQPELGREMRDVVAMLTDVSRYVKKGIDAFLASLPGGV
ncbi:contact-dependent growth inhibition system immunity protein [Streptomyces sp. NPDC058733]|uniref:contact-dependent growth inhibition system immunity protein n=1 Tax=Streptomyces sp. NPDC058733 TaxID=3346614 RepID=UPI0036C5E867